MDTVVLSSLLNGALLLVCVGLLLSFCVSCGQSWTQTSVHQQEMCNPGEVRDVRRMPTVVTNRTPGHSFLNPPWQEPERRPSFTLTDDDLKYVNDTKDADNDVTDEKREYIVVLPDGIPIMKNNGSQSSLSSGNDKTCMNEEQESDSENYVNMQYHKEGGLTPGKSHESVESDGNGTPDYVNTSPK